MAMVPAEDGPHDATFMQWPTSRSIYGGAPLLEKARTAIATVANAISEFEPVIMLGSRRTHDHARRKLSASVELWDIPTDDLWCRDSGPLFAVDDRGSLAVSHIQFNGWGRKQDHAKDARIAEAVADRLDAPLIPSGLTGEAGGVEHDGHGLLMAHRSSWNNPNRNPTLSEEEIERRLLAAYGARQLIWSDGLAGEEITDYHIDSLARFTGPGRVLLNMPSVVDLEDAFHAAAIATRDRLLGAGLEVEVIPEPDNPRVRHADFVASYVNYYVCNGAVIAAEFGDPETDGIAEAALKRHFLGREVVMLNVDTLGEIGGGIHCATQQMPRV